LPLNWGKVNKLAQRQSACNKHPGLKANPFTFHKVVLYQFFSNLPGSGWANVNGLRSSILVPSHAKVPQTADFSPFIGLGRGRRAGFLPTLPARPRGCPPAAAQRSPDLRQFQAGPFMGAE